MLGELARLDKENLEVLQLHVAIEAFAVEVSVWFSDWFVAARKLGTSTKEILAQLVQLLAFVAVVHRLLRRLVAE